jgi:uncharacterized membrane protein YeaQ/YmgE (transglycosylase-associated protein family)
MHTPLAFMSGPHHMHFFTLVIVGGLAGWFAGMITGMRHGIFVNILIGIAGSYLGSELAGMAEVVVRSTLGEVVAATVGAIIVTAVLGFARGNSSRRV